MHKIGFIPGGNYLFEISEIYGDKKKTVSSETIKTFLTMDTARGIMVSNESFSNYVDYHMKLINNLIKKRAEDGHGGCFYVINESECGFMYRDVAKYIAGILQKEYCYHVIAGNTDTCRATGYWIKICWNVFKNSGE